jgi:hypothetical protein
VRVVVEALRRPSHEYVAVVRTDDELMLRALRPDDVPTLGRWLRQPDLGYETDEANDDASVSERYSRDQTTLAPNGSSSTREATSATAAHLLRGEATAVIVDVARPTSGPSGAIRERVSTRFVASRAKMDPAFFSTAAQMHHRG